MMQIGTVLFKQMSWVLGQGSYYLNAGLQFLMASKCLRDLLKDIRRVNSSQLLTQQNEMNFLAVTFAIAFSYTHNDVNYSNIIFEMGVPSKMPVLLYETCLTNVLK